MYGGGSGEVVPIFMNYLEKQKGAIAKTTEACIVQPWKCITPISFIHEGAGQ
jgi:hypothetical protein